MWRYAPVLPASDQFIISLGEGWTPLIHTRRLGAQLGADNLWVKDEGLNPTASFKARGLSCAISMCNELGIQKVAIPSAGNAASALAAYAAAAGLESFIFMPRDVPQANYLECKAYGANVTLVDGLISDCGRIVAERGPQEGWFDVSTLKEPYRIEGKKTMGYEIVEQLGWRCPDVIVYPAGGGVGIIAIHKALLELRELGWIGTDSPRLVAVQAAGCAPIVDAFRGGRDESTAPQNPHTVAFGINVPNALGDFLVLNAVRSTAGTAIAVTDQELLSAQSALAQDEGLWVCPEGAACFAAVSQLRQTGWIGKDEDVVVLNTGTGLIYPDTVSIDVPTLARTGSIPA
jgi:threonine synthase